MLITSEKISPVNFLRASESLSDDSILVMMDWLSSVLTRGETMGYILIIQFMHSMKKRSVSLMSKWWVGSVCVLLSGISMSSLLSFKFGARTDFEVDGSLVNFYEIWAEVVVKIYGLWMENPVMTEMNLLGWSWRIESLKCFWRVMELIMNWLILCSSWI